MITKFKLFENNDEMIKMSNLIYNQDIESIKKMIADGYDINATDKYNNNCLDIAFLHRRYDMFKFFFNLGADVNNVEKNTINSGESLLYRIIKDLKMTILIKSTYTYFDLLITSEKLDVNAGMSPLYLAIRKLNFINKNDRYKMINVINKLIEKDVDLYLDGDSLIDILIEIQPDYIYVFESLFPDKYYEYMKNKNMKKFNI